MFTEAQLKRIKEIRWALAALPGHETKITKDDVALLMARVDDLDAEECSCAGEIIEWARDRLEEDLRSKRSWLEDAVENARIAELMVREAERALAAVQALKDGGMYEAGGEINERWDAIRALYASQGMLVPEQIVAQEQSDNPAPDEPVAALPEPEPEPEPPAREVLFDAERSERGIEALKQYRWEGTEPGPVEPEPEPPAREMDFTEPKWSDEDVAKMNAYPERELVINRIAPFVPRPKPAPSMPANEQDEAIFAALKSAAGDQPEIQVSLPILAAASGVPKGSVHAVLRRLVDAGRIEIIVPEWVSGAKLPNIYRFTGAAPAVEATDEPVPAPEPPMAKEEAQPELPPAVAEAVAERLAAAWGAKVKPPKPTGSVSASAPLRERVLGVLRKSACTTSGLASMLDVKELAICQTLEAMRHEGVVQTDEMPEAGRRAQLWRPAA